jgi:hypothetical protein
MNANWSGIINQNVRSDASPTFANVGITGLGFLKSFLNQTVTTTSSPTFSAVSASNAFFTNLSTTTLNTNSIVTGGTLNVSGNVGLSSALTVGGTIGASTLSVSGGFSGSTSGWQLSPAGTGSFNGGFNLSISANLGVLGNTFIAASDERVKEDIEPIPPNEGLRFVREIGAKTYRHDGALSAGFVAQDVIRKGFQRMVVVSDSDDPRVAAGDDVSPAGRRLNLNYDNATAYQQAALGALLNMIEEMQDEIAELKAARS